MGSGVRGVVGLWGCGVMGLWGREFVGSGVRGVESSWGREFDSVVVW